MKSNQFISIKENRFLTMVALIIFSLTLINLGSIVIEDYNNSVKKQQGQLAFAAAGVRRGGIDFNVYGLPHSYVYEFRFFAVLIFPFVFWAKNTSSLL